MTTDWLSRISAPVVDLSPGAVDLRGYRGDTFATRFTFRQSDGTPVVLTGTWRAQIRADADDTTPLDTFNVDATSQATGVIMLSLSTVQTLGLPQRTMWDLENVASSSTRTWLNGTLYLGGDVTR